MLAHGAVKLYSNESYAAEVIQIEHRSRRARPTYIISIDYTLQATSFLLIIVSFSFRRAELKQFSRTDSREVRAKPAALSAAHCEGKEH